eukprot:Nk52_evm16s369 gene=Nk52_evmTU16s369
MNFISKLIPLAFVLACLIGMTLAMPTSKKNVLSVNDVTYSCQDPTAEVVVVFGVSSDNTNNINTKRAMKPLYISDDYQTDGLVVSLPDTTASSTEYLIGQTSNPAQLPVTLTLSRKDSQSFQVSSVVLPHRVQSVNDTDDEAAHYVTGAKFYDSNTQYVYTKNVFASSETELQLNHKFTDMTLMASYYSELWQPRGGSNLDFNQFALNMKPSGNEGAGFWVCVGSSSEETVENKASAKDENNVELGKGSSDCEMTYKDGKMTDCHGRVFDFPCQAGGSPLVIYSHFPHSTASVLEPAYVADGYVASSLSIAGGSQVDAGSGKLKVSSPNPNSASLSYTLKKENGLPFYLTSPYFPSIYRDEDDNGYYMENIYINTDATTYATVVPFISYSFDWVSFFVMDQLTTSLEASLFPYKEDTDMGSSTYITLNFASKTGGSGNGFWVCGADKEIASSSQYSSMEMVTVTNQS